jgi:1-deoxyxylulose-5-phosphate synthase
MKNISRRRFIRHGSAALAGMAALGAMHGNLSCSLLNRDQKVDLVKLGNTGLKVPRIAFGTGTFGWRYESSQSKLGIENFVNMAQYCYDRGIRFLETADMYGTHEHVGAALKVLPREKVTVLSKVMVYQQRGWYEPELFEKSLDRFRKAMQIDYIDIMLLHALSSPTWTDDYRHYMDALSEAQQKGIIKAVGVSCHNVDAMRLASETPWVEVLLAQINHQGPRMDGPPEVVMPILANARKNGKGVIAMKVFGCGQLVEDDQREASLNYVLKSGNVDCLTLGMVNTDEVDDNIERVMRIANS